jgi:hypothetical protein
MIIERIINGVRFECRRDMVEVTMNGMFGGKADESRVFLPGIALYHIDGQAVSEDEFTRRLTEASRVIADDDPH